MMTLAPISIVIPSWNGAALLRRYLPSVLNEMRECNPQSECIVVDDGSTDDSCETLISDFPGIRVVRHHRNVGFGAAANSGVHAAKREWILLLNNDIEIKPGAIRKLLERLPQEQSQVFAITGIQVTQNDARAVENGFYTMDYEHGHFEVRDQTEKFLAGNNLELAYVSGGYALLSRSKFVELGGFCPLFNPFYYEDTELGIQARKRGWKLLFVPESVVTHHPSTTTRKKVWAFRFLPVRNYFILHWLTLDDDADLWRQHVKAVLKRSLVWSLQGRVRYVAGLFLALTKLGEIRKQRNLRSRGSVYPLRQLLSIKP